MKDKQITSNEYDTLINKLCIHYGCVGNSNTQVEQREALKLYDIEALRTLVLLTSI